MFLLSVDIPPRDAFATGFGNIALERLSVAKPCTGRRFAPQRKHIDERKNGVLYSTTDRL